MRLSSKRVLHIAFIVATAFWCGFAMAAVMTASGPVQGANEGDLTVYKGLPFAAPPVGDLRWRAPQPVKPWKDVKLLDHYGPGCMQQGMYPPDAPARPHSEDCLYLNLWVPAHRSGEKLPVMVWVYGGGLENGSGSIPLYDGGVLARRGVIVVTFNYRLGVFGFLALPGLARESPSHTSGDYGLLDQIAALRWVQRNIAAFGGDPSRVTVFGQSSGSISISALSVSPLAGGLFRYAIGESGALMEPMQLAGNLAEKSAQDDGLAFMRRVGASSLAALRRMPAQALLKAPFTPAIILDGNVLDESPAQSWRSGRINPSALMIGSNHDEGVIFLTRKRVTPANYDEVLGHDFPTWLVKLAAPSPGNTPRAAYDAAERFEGDMRFHWDMWTWARLASKAGKPVYFYQFDHPAPCAAAEGCVNATRHGDEMPYVFGNHPRRPWSAQDQALSNRMVDCWTRFARMGSPDGCGLPAWPPYRDGASMMVLGSHPHLVHMRPDRTLRRLDAIYDWAGVIVPHPMVALGIALLMLAAIIFLLVLAARWCVRRARANRLRA
jgi:para-nitrobenzyl esterase